MAPLGRVTPVVADGLKANRHYGQVTVIDESGGELGVGGVVQLPGAM
jgi:hypothetical protein